MPLPAFVQSSPSTTIDSIFRQRVEFTGCHQLALKYEARVHYRPDLIRWKWLQPL